MPISNVFNQDCILGMKEFPDKFFELAIVDPPYGINAGNVYSETSKLHGNSAALRSAYKINWDNAVPDNSYFDELKRVSKNQIIWGENYYNYHFGLGRIFWDKDTGNNDFSDGEIAYCSLFDSVRKVKIRWNGMLQYDMSNKETRIHPTHKPIALYKWLLQNYAKPNDKILDTHLGSQSSRIAAYKLGFDFWGYELDEDYFKQGCERFEKSIAEPLFDAPKTFEQGNFFTQKPQI